MAETLEDILEKATNPKNFGDNTAFANVFSEQINKEFDGPARAVRLLSQKLSLHQETVSLQTLTVIEICVKNCGQRFHQEIGKYRFLNELIKLLSPKYDGDITAQAVKDRVAELLFNWCVGLPSEVKIAEAYKMLKQQGVIKKDPVSEESARSMSRPTNTALDDEEKSKLLAMLLKSKNPEDLQAANKLIKTMVKQEEERLEKFSKRVQELETVSNNVALLNEMIDAYTPSMSESDQVVMRDLYEACLSMRTHLFRIASQCVEDKDDTLSEILALSDDLTKAIDKYKSVVIQGEPNTADAQAEAAQPKHEDPSQAQTSVDSLLDIGLGFNDQPPSNAAEQQTSSSFLDDQFKLLGLDGGTAAPSNNIAFSEASTGNEWGAFGSAFTQPPQNSIPQQSSMPPQGQFYASPQFNPSLGHLGGIAPMAPQGKVTLKNYSLPPTQNSRPTNSPSVGGAQGKGATTRAPANDLLGFDVFADFKKEDVKKTKEVNEVKNAAVSKPTQSESLLDLDDDVPLNGNLYSSREKPEEKLAESKTENLSAVARYFVPLEAIEPTSHTPINVLDKDGLKIILNIVKDKRDEANPNVTAVVFTTISTNVAPISEYKVEVSVPKSMKIKLQPPSSTALPPFNPLLPPSAITQIMLIANPTKEAIHLKIRISFKSGSEPKVEIVTVDSFPVT